MKNSISIVILSFVFCLMSNTTCAQNDKIQISHSGLIFYQGKPYKLHKLDPIFNENPTLSNMYSQAKSNRWKAAPILVFGTMIGGCVTYLGVAFTAFDAPILGVPLTGIGLITMFQAFNISQKIMKDSKEKIYQTVNLFNGEPLPDYIKKETSSLQLKGTANGYGLVYQF